MIELRLFATLREGREKISQLVPEDFPNGEAIVAHYNIPLDQVSIYLINGIHSKLSDKISDGDVIAIFPPVGGG